MPSKYLYVVQVGPAKCDFVMRKITEAHLVAAYSKEEAVKLVFGDVVFQRSRELARFMLNHRMAGMVVVVKDVNDKMVKKTEKNFYVQLRDGYMFRNENEVKEYFNKCKYFAEQLKKWIVFVDKFGKREDVKSFYFD